LSDQYEDMRKRLQESEGQVVELQTYNANLSEQVQQLQHQTDQLTHQINLLEQYSRRDFQAYPWDVSHGMGRDITHLYFP